MRQRLMMAVVGLIVPLAAQAAEPVHEVTYFSGSTMVRLQDGRNVVASDSWVCRTVDQASNTITEQLITIDHRPNVPAREFIVTFHVTEDGTFTMQERKKAFVGAGYLQGPAWHWTAWHSLSLLPDGAYVDSKDQRVSDGLMIEKLWCDAFGHSSVSMSEQLKPVTAAEFQAKRRQVLPD